MMNCITDWKMNKKKTEKQQEDVNKHIENKTRVGLLRRAIDEEQKQELKEFMENYGPIRTNLK